MPALATAPAPADCRSPILPLLLAAHTGGCSMGVEGCAASVGTMHTQPPRGELAHRHAMVPAPPPVADCRSPILPLLLAAHTGGCSMGVEGCAASVGTMHTQPPRGELAHRHAMVPAPPPVADCRSPILPLLLAAHTGGCSMG
eukprot:COSAG01_NODE_2798_length_7055_cov_6.733611_5_plen_142_part_01